MSDDASDEFARHADDDMMKMRQRANRLTEDAAKVRTSIRHKIPLVAEDVERWHERRCAMSDKKTDKHGMSCACEMDEGLEGVCKYHAELINQAVTKALQNFQNDGAIRHNDDETPILKPCTHCGHCAETQCDDVGATQVRCTECGMRTGRYAQWKQAYFSWNRRPHGTEHEVMAKRHEHQNGIRSQGDPTEVENIRAVTAKEAEALINNPDGRLMEKRPQTQELLAASIVDDLVEEIASWGGIDREWFNDPVRGQLIGIVQKRMDED